LRSYATVPPSHPHWAPRSLGAFAYFNSHNQPDEYVASGSHKHGGPSGACRGFKARSASRTSSRSPTSRRGASRCLPNSLHWQAAVSPLSGHALGRGAVDPPHGHARLEHHRRAESFRRKPGHWRMIVGCRRLRIGLFERFSSASHLPPVATGCARWAP
jgi:hypothetical protein